MANFVVLQGADGDQKGEGIGRSIVGKIGRREGARSYVRGSHVEGKCIPVSYQWGTNAVKMRGRRSGTSTAYTERHLHFQAVHRT